MNYVLLRVYHATIRSTSSNEQIFKIFMLTAALLVDETQGAQEAELGGRGPWVMWGQVRDGCAIGRTLVAGLPLGGPVLVVQGGRTVPRIRSADSAAGPATPKTRAASS